MSIRTNKMKAVAVLLKQLTTTRKKFHEKGRDESFDKKLEKLRLDLNRIKDVFVEVKKNEEKLLDTLAEVYNHLRRLDRKKLDEDMEGICKRIRDSAHNLLPQDAFDKLSKEDDHTLLPTLDQNKSWTAEDFNLLGLPSRFCMFSLLIFPENAVIRKRNAIHLWIEEGLITNTEKKTAEEKGEDVIHDLLKFKVIVRYGSRKDPIVNKFQILPQVRSQLKLYLDGDSEYIRPSRLLLDRKKVTVGGVDTKNVTLRNIYNIGASYLNFGPQWVSDQWKNLEVLQLGRWQDSPLHHIEVGSEEFLRELRTMKLLKYLSLRGISRIFELPSSIVELENLEILDLKACHNLETLPDDISSMKSLTHLIMSECSLLEVMPKGIEKLTNLQVLKGFLITTSEKTPCRLSDLAKNLTEFKSLENLRKLKHLKISWSVSDPSYAKISILLPKSLRKLHLECFPGKSLEECLLKENFVKSINGEHDIDIVRELNITGGKLKSICVSMMKWNVEILRLKYLKQLNVDINHLKVFFPFLQYVEIKQISNHSYLERKYDVMVIEKKR